MKGSPLRPQIDVNRRLVVVDDDEAVRRVVAELLKEESYETFMSEDAVSALNCVDEIHPALVITDMKMPEHDGLWLLKNIKESFPDIAVIMMTGYGQVETAVHALKVGASDYLTKPIRVAELATSVERALEGRRLKLENRAYQERLEEMVAEKTRELAGAYHKINENYNLTLEALVTALDARECETSNHSQRVVRSTLAIADRMGITGEEREHVARGALLHDIGKIGVPDGVLLKPGKLNEEEWVEMRKHPEIGARILSGIEFLAPAAEIVLAHQERWDGGGYPRGLKAEDIPIGARIFAVADALDAITSDRPYRRGRSLEYARDEIAQHSGTQFDPQVVEVFLSIDLDEWRQIRSGRSLFKARPPSVARHPGD